MFKHILCIYVVIYAFNDDFFVETFIDEYTKEFLRLSSALSCWQGCMWVG